ncbi:hypothetical protein HJ014_22780 [Vibrio parahaemolyticus]|nr:hypothetical protein [Vibrio parahaemolyticus]
MKQIELNEAKYLGSSDKKKHIHLTKYVQSLFEKGRIIEAEFFHNELLKLKPDHLIVQVIGYELAIRTFNYNKVVKFDGLLSKNKKLKKEELLKLRVKYFYSIQNSEHLEFTLNELLSITKYDERFFPVVVDSIYFTKSYLNVYNLFKLLRKSNLKLDSRNEDNMRKIVYTSLCNKLVEIANG